MRYIAQNKIRTMLSFHLVKAKYSKTYAPCPVLRRCSFTVLEVKSAVLKLAITKLPIP